jgi:hypothetical protein
MDVETAEALDSIRGDIRRVETTFATQMDELRTEIDERRTGIWESAAAGRRHNEVLFESLRDDIQLVAEGLAVVGANVDRLTR